jgi:hypothetical protein
MHQDSLHFPSRETDIQRIRPQLPIEITDGMSDIERFQTETLRPVLKMQHDLLKAIFANYLTQQKVKPQALSVEQYTDFVYQALTKDQALKNILLGTIIGQFTLDEYHFYSANRQEIAKRLMKFMAKRIAGS